MDKNYCLKITELEEIVFNYSVSSIQEWLENTCSEFIRKNTDDIIKLSVNKFLNNNEQIPPSKEQIILEAKKRGWIDKKLY